MNALNGVQSYTKILQVKNQQEKDFVKKPNFKDVKFPIKISVKKNSIGISVFDYVNKEKHPIFVSKKCCEVKHVDLLLIQEEGKRYYVIIKVFNTPMYNHTLHRRKKYFQRYCSQAFSTEEVLKRDIKDYFKVNRKQKIKIPKKGEYVKLKNYERKIKSPFII